MKLGPIIKKLNNIYFRSVLDNNLDITDIVAKCVPSNNAITFQEIEAQQRASFIINTYPRGSYNIAPKIYEIIKNEHDVCILMEHIEGLTLNEYLKLNNITDNSQVPDHLKKNLYTLFKLLYDNGIYHLERCGF